MKKLYSFLFLLFILLNAGGYYEILIVIQQQQLNETISEISKNQDEISGNLLLRIPMSLPYSHNDSEYSRAFGEIVVEGQLYHFVKQKLYQDTLYVVCLMDSKSTNARNAVSDYSRTFANQHPKSEGSGKSLIITLTKFCMFSGKASQNHVSGWISILQSLPAENLYKFSSMASIFHPPC